MAYIKRELEQVVLEVSKEYPVVILTGPRQVGKTTMLQKLMQGSERNYVTLDDLNERALAQSDPQMFFQMHKPPLLIDEVQYAPELLIYVKILADRDYRPGDFWLTVSQAFRLTELAGESLAGLACLLHMTTLSQSERYGDGFGKPLPLSVDALQERVKHRRPAETPEIFQRIFQGSMPALASGAITKRNRFYSSYIATYILSGIFASSAGRLTRWNSFGFLRQSHAARGRW